MNLYFFLWIWEAENTMSFYMLCDGVYGILYTSMPRKQDVPKKTWKTTKGLLTDNLERIKGFSTYTKM